MENRQDNSTAQVKDADANNPCSFRPVAQLGVISKISRKMCPTTVTGFPRSNWPVEHESPRVQEATKYLDGNWTNHGHNWTSIDNNEIAATMGVDQSAAFDCVEHVILKKKLEYYNLGDDCLKWLHSYLDFRSSYVSIGSAISDIVKTEYGVPQGSVLGPLLYLCYILTIFRDH